MLRPLTRLEQYLAKIAGAADTAPAPLTRLEQFLAKIAGITNTAPAPLTRMEQYLSMIAENGGGGGGGNTETRIYTPESDVGQFGVTNPRETAPKMVLIYHSGDVSDWASAYIIGAFACFLPPFRWGTNTNYVRYSSLIRATTNASPADRAHQSISAGLAGLNADNTTIVMPTYSSNKYKGGESYTITFFY
jgi:hypothetical protein